MCRTEMESYPGRRVYIFTLFLLAIEILIFCSGRISIDLSSAEGIVTKVAITAILYVVIICMNLYCLGILPQASHVEYKKYTDPLQIFFGNYLFVVLTPPTVAFLNYLTMGIRFPYVDTWLAEYDRMMHLDWIKYFMFVADHVVLARVMLIFYSLLFFMLMISYFGLMACRNYRRANFLILSTFFTALVCVTLGMFFPAEGAVQYLLHGIASGHNPKIIIPGMMHIENLHKLRSGLPVVLDLRHMPGLVTFPSFHAAAGVCLCWSWRRTRFFYPMLAYLLVMLASTPVYGAHYFVDIIAGLVIAGCVLAYMSSQKHHQSLFSPAGVQDPTGVTSLDVAVTQ